MSPPSTHLRLRMAKIGISTPSVTLMPPYHTLPTQRWKVTMISAPPMTCSSLPFITTSSNPLTAFHHSSSSSIPSSALNLWESPTTTTTTATLPYQPKTYTNIDFLNSLRIIPSLLPHPPKYFSPRPLPTPQLFLNRHYITSTLRSYPSLLLASPSNRSTDQNPHHYQYPYTLPPFIHPQCLINISGDDTIQHTSLPGPLANCAKIMAMWEVKTAANTNIIWNRIRAEQRKLFSEVG